MPKINNQQNLPHELDLLSDGAVGLYKRITEDCHNTYKKKLIKNFGLTMFRIGNLYTKYRFVYSDDEQ